MVASAQPLCGELHSHIRDSDQYGVLPPVLKHGPRSLTYTRVVGCQTQMRNESEGRHVRFLRCDCGPRGCMQHRPVGHL